MRKILIAGPIGAGKTELATMLMGKQTNYGYQTNGEQPVSIKDVHLFDGYIFDNCIEGADDAVRQLFERPNTNDNCTIVAVYNQLPIWSDELDDTYTYTLK